MDSLGVSALASANVFQREALLSAQFELNRKLAIFALTFNEALDTDVARQAGTLDIGVETIAVEHYEVLTDTLLRTDALSGATTHLLELEIARAERREGPLALVMLSADALARAGMAPFKVKSA